MLGRAAAAWFIAALIGQWAFAGYIVGFYGPSLATGRFEGWWRNRNLLTGYVAGDLAGNLLFAAHVGLAAILSLGGALQLVPALRARAMAVHRWNGRLFVLTALAISLDGLYLVWGRHSRTDTLGGIAISLNAALIVACVALAWRTALTGEVAAHRRWALRSYVVANGQWMFRIGVFGVMLLAKSWVKPVFVVWEFGCYLAPLALVEVYLHARDATGAAGRLALAGALIVLTALTGLGVVGAYLLAWRPLL